MRILLVDDDDEARMLWALALGRAGHEVQQARTVAEAISLGRGLQVEVLVNIVNQKGAPKERPFDFIASRPLRTHRRFLRRRSGQHRSTCLRGWRQSTRRS